MPPPTPRSLEALLANMRIELDLLAQRGSTQDAARLRKAMGMLMVDDEFPAAGMSLMPLLQGTWRDAGATTGNLATFNYGRPKAFQTPNGWVTMRGLIRSTSAIAAGSLLLTLPEGWRPPQTMVFPAWTGANAVAGPNGIQITTDGVVTLLNSMAAPAEVSLANVFYNVNAYTAHALVSPFTAYNSATFGVPGYYRSPDGIVGHAGAVQGGTVGDFAVSLVGDARLPTDLSPTTPTQVHIPAVSSTGAFAYLNADSGAQQLRTRVAVPQHISGAAHLGINHTVPKRPVAFFLNSWSNYGTNFPPVMAVKTDDGLVMLHGLLSTAGRSLSATFNLPEGMRPRGHIIRQSITNDAFGRVDIGVNGDVIAASFLGAWLSLDGITFAAEQ